MRFELSEDDQKNLLAVLNNTSFKGSEVEYVSQLKVKLSNPVIEEPVKKEEPIKEK